MTKLAKVELQLLTILVLEVVAALILALFGYVLVATIIAGVIVINALLAWWIILTSRKTQSKSAINISRVLGNDVKDALSLAKMGIVTYDANYTVTWISEYLSQQNASLVGKKLTAWMPEINRLFQDDVDTITAHDGKHLYEVVRKENAQVLFVKDIETYVNVKNRLEKEQLVLGILHIDNYAELAEYSDDAKVNMINTTIRPLVNQWAKANNIVLRRLKSDRYFMVLNEETYQNLVMQKFAILNQVRLESQSIDLPITLSLAFVRGNADLVELDGVLNDLIELAQVRGGDQIVSKRHGEDTEFYGGGSQAQEKRSRVRVRIMAQAIKEAILEADRIFVVGHKVMDFDCMGSALAMSRIAQAYGKETYIVSKSGGIEPQLQDTMNVMKEEFETRHRFISDQEAVRLVSGNDLILVVDHHNPKHANAPLLIERVERKIVIDHHRRSESFYENPLIVYVETSASSVSELVAEMLDYQGNKIDISEDEAMVMYLGLLIDTNHFKNRTGVRTFEAAAKLKSYGVDPLEAEELLQENYQDFEAKALIMKYVTRYNPQIIVAAVTELTHLNRTIMSQVADTLLSIKDIEAAFVIGYIDDQLVAVSSRSREKVNVQYIMEKMQGGGHFNAAALQRERSNVEAIRDELYQILDEVVAQEETL
ncbi:MAG: DHH family phosphoesterase [Erysipelotrichaceae bacterium]